MAEELRSRPSVGPSYYKAHGHGNDYLVFEAGPGPVVTPAWIQRVCDRWRGVGADGIVVVGRGEEGDAALLRMFNPDGSEFERSGNGLRVAALYLAGKGRVGEKGDVTVSVGGDRIRMVVGARDGEGAADVVVEMGIVTFPEGPPFVSPGAVEGDSVVLAEGIRGVPVSVGNPHVVLFGRDWDDARFPRLGAYIATHTAFPQGTNVQFATDPEGRTLSIRIWERGVGPTSSSGTSACAAAAAAVRTGRLTPGAVDVRMEGGSFRVTVAEDWRVVLEGPVEPVCTGRLEPPLIHAGQTS